MHLKAKMLSVFIYFDSGACSLVVRLTGIQGWLYSWLNSLPEFLKGHELLEIQVWASWMQYTNFNSLHPLQIPVLSLVLRSLLVN